MRLRKRQEPITIFNSVDTHELWRQGFVGYLSRLRGAGIILFSNFVVGGGVFAWAHAVRPLDSETISLFELVLILAGIAMIVSMAHWWIIRKYRARLLIMQEKLHLFSHLVRDKVVSVNKATCAGKSPLQQPVCNEILETSVSAMADAARKYMQISVGDDTVKCSIRLAEMSKDNGTAKDVVYTIAGRSSGFDPNRAVTSISSDEGVPGYFLREQKRQGVLVYHDIIEAEKIGVLQRTENDEKFPDDFKSFMVSPINGRENPDRFSMIGLLYVFSKKDPFNAYHVDAVRGISDILGVALPELVGLLYNRGNRKMKEGA